MSEHEKNLEAWVERIADRDMPVFGRTAEQLACLVDDESRHRSSLTQVILHDAGLTARILRLANSAFYNSGSRKLTTVSRAVLVLGVNGIRNICLSIAMIDSLLKGENKEVVAREMGKAFYAAVIARMVAERQNDPQPEEVFIAALLYRLGELAFRCFGEGTALELDAAIERFQGDRAEAEKEVLNFRLSELTRELAKKWQLGELLEQSLLPDGQRPRRVQGIVAAQRLADEAEGGTDNPRLKALLRELSEVSSLPLKGIEELVRTASGLAAGAAKEYGATAAAHHIRKMAKLQGMPAMQLVPADDDEPPAEIMEPDPLLQLRILRELSAVLGEQPDFNQVLEIVLEGIYRGVGMDLAVFGLLTLDRKRIKAKFALGAESSRIMDNMDLEIALDSKNVFSEVIEKQHPRWVSVIDKQEGLAQIGRAGLALFGSSSFFIAPTIVTGRAIGIFYADRKVTKRALDAESYESFKHFAVQANLALDVLARKK